jgi:hypothetical protein
VKKPDRKLIAVLGLLVGAVCAEQGPPPAGGGSAAKQYAFENPEARAAYGAPDKKLASTGDF